MKMIKWFKENWILVLIMILIAFCLAIVIKYPIHTGFE